MIGYKGFDKNFCCHDFQFEVGKTYKHDGRLKLCESGFHFCQFPLAVLIFYPPVNGNRYALVEVTGKIIFAQDETYKAVTDEIKIVRELSLDELIATVPKTDTATNTGNRSAATNTGNCSAATNTGYQSVATNTGCRSVATNTGCRSVATNTGDCSAATNTGDCSIAANTGENSTAITSGKFSIASTVGNKSESKVTGNSSVAVSIGRVSRAIVSGERSIAVASGPASSAKGAIDCWLVLGEWDSRSLIDVQLFKVDGVTIKPDTFYRLKDGKPVAVDD